MSNTWRVCVELAGKVVSNPMITVPGFGES